MQTMRILQVFILIILLQACASVPEPDTPPAVAVEDKTIDHIYKIRTWIPPSELTIDPITLGKEVQVPNNMASAKIIGPSHNDALDSLATKIWLIENAQHTIDATYYIFKPDLVGYARWLMQCSKTWCGCTYYG